MKLEILQNSDVMEKKRIPDSDSATQNCMETSSFVSGQKVELILLTCVIAQSSNVCQQRKQSVSAKTKKLKTQIKHT